MLHGNKAKSIPKFHNKLLLFIFLDDKNTQFSSFVKCLVKVHRKSVIVGIPGIVYTECNKVVVKVLMLVVDLILLLVGSSIAYN